MTCGWCSAELTPAATGRPRRFCSEQCRKARHQRERTLRRQVERFRYLARMNPEPYRSYWASRQADAQAELTRQGGNPDQGQQLTAREG
ncbi:hypothetical protein GCM10009730_42270 [Streptomyces albidochromogenes]|uniref:hypothetical protein n=1 Tax=Streptomyces albidochromogenes TaxID=329524 RepID=UPI00110FEDC5|nr:hypothetical protein [Streptomyces albidochromogenes]